MRRSLAACLGGLCLLLGLSVSALAQEIAFVDSERILEGYTEVKNVQDNYQADIRAWNEQAQNLKREIDRLATELAQQGPGLSDEKRREKEEDHQSKVSEYDRFVQSVWGPNGLVIQRNEEVMRPIIRRIQTILSEIGDERGYDLILDAADGNILYADPALDLTEEVIERLNGS